MSKFRLTVVVLFALFFASSVYAADIAVDADCSLADAIIAANRDRAEGNCPAGRGADTIILSQDITLDGSLPKITSNITIEGNGYTISGDNRYRIFYNDGGALTINNLTMTKGYVEGDGSGFGGAIYNRDGTLTISGSNFSDNLAEYNGGAIYNDGELSISDSIFSDNLADEDGGAIYNRDGTLNISDSVFSDNLAGLTGNVIYNNGELSITSSAFSDNVGNAVENRGELSIVNSTFSHNSAWAGGAISNNPGGELSIINSTFSHNLAWTGGAIHNSGSGELNISGSTFSHNSADVDGGAIFNDGELSIVNSTFSHNSADIGGAIKNSGWGNLRISSSTFSGNSAKHGGAIDNGYEGKLRMRNSIIAGNGVTCASSNRIRHNISNFIQDGSCSSDFSGDPKLGELVEPEDGSPAYYPLLAGSPAIDVADDDYCPETDQIGTARPQGAACDIGAIEYVAP